MNTPESEWFEWFYQNADFGAGDEDFRFAIYEQYKASGGTPVPFMEGEK